MGINIHQKVIFAVRGGNLELVKERVSSGGDLNYQDSTHGSALVAAIKSGNEEILSWLVENGVDVNAENEYGKSPLEVALHNPNSAIVRKLVWGGAKLEKKARPYYAERLTECLKNG